MTTPGLTGPTAPQGTLPRISLVTPSYNQGAFLERAIQSVVNQRYPNLEYVVIDGGSADDSPTIIKRYEASLAHWESQPDRGPGHALNRGFAKTTGEIMGWLNADDIYLPHTLRAVGQIFGDFPEIQWLTSGAINISSDDTLFAIQTSRKWLSRWTQVFHRSPPPQHCTFWRRSLWERAGGCVVEETPYVDCELWLRFYEQTRPYVADTIFGAWRLHDTSYSTARLGSLYAQMDQAHRAPVEAYLRKRPALRVVYPLLWLQYRVLDRGYLSRLMFELVTRRSRFLTFNLETGRFALRRGGWLPRPWPETIGLPQTRASEAVPGCSGWGRG